MYNIYYYYIIIYSISFYLSPFDIQNNFKFQILGSQRLPVGWLMASDKRDQRGWHDVISISLILVAR